MSIVAKHGECSPEQIRDLEDMVAVSLTCLGGAELDLGPLPRTARIKDVRDLVQEHLASIVAGWTLLYGADILSDGNTTLAQLCGWTAHSIHLTVVQDVAPKFTCCTANSKLLNDGHRFQGPCAGYGYAWALVQPSCSILTVRLGPMCGRGASYFLGVVPQKFFDRPMCDITTGYIAGVCLYISGEGRFTGKVKRAMEQRVDTNSSSNFTQSTFTEGDWVSVELDRRAGVCRFGKGDPETGVEWSEHFQVPFQGVPGVGIFSKGHATICS